MAMTKNAVIVVASVEVLCPHCAEPQPSPDNGSHMWLPEQARKMAGRRTCVACKTEFRLILPKQAALYEVE